jgi:hypothetical protein
VPENYLIGPDGRVRQVVVGPVDAEYLDDQVVPLLPGGRS